MFGGMGMGPSSLFRPLSFFGSPSFNSRVSPFQAQSIFRRDLLRDGYDFSSQKPTEKPKHRQILDSFTPGTALTRVSGDEALGIGGNTHTGGYAPSGQFTTTHGQLFGPSGVRKSKATIKSELALPRMSDPDSIYRPHFPPGLTHIAGEVGPQGPDDVFDELPGGGTQIATGSRPFHMSKGKPVPSSVIMEKLDGGRRNPNGTPQHTRSYDDLN
jgi:hypothetical protein